MPERASELEGQIASWSAYLRRRRAVAGPDVDELEGHLRDQIDDLVRAGLSDDEAFFVAIKRIGSLDEVSREYAREHSDRLWKQLVMDDRARALAAAAPDSAGRGPRGRRSAARSRRPHSSVSRSRVTRSST